jgi:hypothetical protein
MVCLPGELPNHYCLAMVDISSHLSLYLSLLLRRVSQKLWEHGKKLQTPYNC